MNKTIRFTSLMLALILTACTALPNHTTHSNTPMLAFDDKTYTVQDVDLNGKTIKVRAYENIPYVANPSEPDYQRINIYIPESYFSGSTINGYNKDTAPIFYPNAVGGYMPAKPMTIGVGMNGKPNSVVYALHRGMVVASAGARGRTQGVGKAPASIVDLKAGIRYLSANDALMAGDANKIIVSGTSAGGAMSALLGATGDHVDYATELDKIGAVSGLDRVFAVMSYCPITNLDHADMAYEWQLSDIHDYNKMSITMLDYQVKRELIPAKLSTEQIALARQLKDSFPNYINGLNLKGHHGQPLTLDKDGNGTFKDEVLYHLNRSLNTAYQSGINLNDYSFIGKNTSAIPYYISDYSGFLRSYVGRSKGSPAFDDVNLSSGENELFGSDKQNARHFTAFAMANSTASKASMADKQTIKMLNPLPYLDDKHAKVAQHWRIRHGAKDSDTGFAVPIILATKLQNQGKNVDFSMPWGQGHGGDYDLDELFDWADKVSKE